MGIFSKKKEAPVSTVTEVDERGPFREVRCSVTVSSDGRTHPVESDGFIRFYPDEVSVYGPAENPASAKNLAKGMLFGALASSPRIVELLRLPYAEIARLSFPRKITARMDLRDGRYAYFVLLGSKREEFVGNFAAHGVTVAPNG